MTEKIDKTIERIAKTFSGLHLSETHLKGILIGFKNEVREQTVKEVIEKIKKELLEWDEENNGYSVGYNACLREVKDILNKYE